MSILLQLPAEIWHEIYCQLSVRDIVTLDGSGHSIRNENDECWRFLLKRNFVASTVVLEAQEREDSKILDFRAMFLSVANTTFEREKLPKISIRDDCRFVPHPAQRLTMSPFSLGVNWKGQVDVWDFSSLSLYTFEPPIGADCHHQFGMNGDVVALKEERDQVWVEMGGAEQSEMRIALSRRSHIKHLTLLANPQRSDCAFVRSQTSSRTSYIDWHNGQLVDIGDSQAVHVANGLIYALGGYSLRAFDLSGASSDVAVEFDRAYSEPGLRAGNTRYLVVVQAHPSHSELHTRLVYLIDTVDNSYVVISTDYDGFPREIQVLPNEIILWYSLRRGNLTTRVQGPMR